MNSDNQSSTLKESDITSVTKGKSSLGKDVSNL